MALFEPALLFKIIHMEKRNLKHSCAVGATIELALNHCTTVTWV